MGSCSSGQGREKANHSSQKTARRLITAAPFCRLAFYMLFMSMPACGSVAGLAGAAGFPVAFGADLAAGAEVEVVIAAGMAIIGSPRSIASIISTSICWSALVFAACARTAAVAPLASAWSVFF